MDDEGKCSQKNNKNRYWKDSRGQSNAQIFARLSQCRNPNWAKCGGEAQHLEKLGIWSPPGLPNVQSSTAGPKIGHLDICRPSYGQKKGRESNWQFDSRSLKVGNRPLPEVRIGSAIRR